MAAMERNRTSKWDTSTVSMSHKSSLEAASEAAAKVNAMLIAKGKLKPSQLSQPAVSQKPKISPVAITGAPNIANQAQSSNLIVAEVEINDVPIGCRNMLTRGSTQDEISKMSGAAVSTRGRYLSNQEKSSGSSDRPLYLCVQGATQDSVDKAVVRIREIIANGYKHKAAKMAAPPPGAPNLLLPPPGAGVLGPPPPQALLSIPPPSLPVTTIPPLMSINTQPAGLPCVQDKVYVGLEHAPPTFDVKEKLIGPGGSFLQHISNETGAKVSLRGKGSGAIDPMSGTEGFEPLHIHLQHPNIAGLQQAKDLAFNLTQTVQQEYAQFQQVLAAMPPAVAPGTAALLHSLQQQTGPLLAPPPGTGIATSLGQTQVPTSVPATIPSLLGAPGLMNFTVPPSSALLPPPTTTILPSSEAQLLAAQPQNLLSGLPSISMANLIRSTKDPTIQFTMPRNITPITSSPGSLPGSVQSNQAVINLLQPPTQTSEPGQQLIVPASIAGGPTIPNQLDQLRLQLSQQQQSIHLGPPPSAQPHLGQQHLGQPQLGQPQLGQPQLGQPQLGQPQLGQPQLGQPPPGTSVTDQPPPSVELQLQHSQQPQPSPNPQLGLLQGSQLTSQPHELAQLGAPHLSTAQTPLQRQSAGLQVLAKQFSQQTAQPGLSQQQEYPSRIVAGDISVANTTSTAFPHGAPTYYNTYAGSALEREQEARKRRFTEEKEEEKLPDNLLGYQHGPTHLVNLVSSTPPPPPPAGLQQQQPAQTYGLGAPPPPPPPTDEAQRVSSQSVDNLLMPPPPPPPLGALGDANRDKHLMPPPPPPPPGVETSHKRLKGALHGVEAYGSDEEEEVNSTMRQQQREAAKYSYNQYSSKPQIYPQSSQPQYTINSQAGLEQTQFRDIFENTTSQFNPNQFHQGQGQIVPPPSQQSPVQHLNRQTAESFAGRGVGPESFSNPARSSQFQTPPPEVPFWMTQS